MVDQNGKLLVGQSRSIIPFTNLTDKPAGIARNPTHITNLKIDDLVEVFLRCKNMYLFYSDYLLWVIGKCVGHMKEYENEFNCYVDGSVVDEASPYFEISGYDSNDIKLVISPLNIGIETFLCVYFEPAYNLRNSVNGSEEEFKGLLNRINNSIL